MFSLPQEPQPIGKVLDTAFKLYREAFKHVLPLAALYAVVTQLPNMVASRVPMAAADSSIAGMVSIAVLAGLIFGVVLYAALIHAIDRVAHGEQQPLGASIARAFGKLVPLLGVIILTLLAVTTGVILLVIPGLIVMLTLMLGSALVMLEDRRVFEALGRSHRLVWGDWWRTLAELTVIGLIYIIPFILVGGVVGGAVGLTGNAQASQSLVADLALMVVQMLLIPLMVAGYLAIFYDRCLRKEGSDLEARLSAQG
jgi:heme/copper-type cytochrome/quinol oxidase subunit 2